MIYFFRLTTLPAAQQGCNYFANHHSAIDLFMVMPSVSKGQTIVILPLFTVARNGFM